MGSLTMEFKYNEGNNEIILNFGDSDEIKVDITGDIDLSEYIRKLTYLIEKRKRLDFQVVAIEDPKIELIQNTINDIVTSYNESLNIEDDSWD